MRWIFEPVLSICALMVFKFVCFFVVAEIKQKYFASLFEFTYQF
jgi:hypothetical protein